MDIKSYINDLFKYLDDFENRYSEFETEAFLQTYNGIYAVFQALRLQRNEAIDVDQYFLERIKKLPITSSDLRQLSIQVLITFFESEADIDGKSNRSYLHCRDLRPVKRDIAFFENHLIPILFRDGSLNNNYRLNSYFLHEIARYLNKFGQGIQPSLTPEGFNALGDPAKFLELMRRRLTLGEDLLRDRSSLEFDLQRVDTFNKLGKKNRLFENYLTEWDYLRKSNFWANLKGSFINLWGKIKGAFSSARYFRLVMAQRPAAYFLYSIFIILFLILALYVPSKWQKYKEDRLEEFRTKAATIHQGPGK